MAGKKLEGRVALITGGSRGIGAAIARAFAEEGAAIAFSYRAAKDQADGVVGEIEALGCSVIAIRADVSKQEDVERMIRETVSKFGTIDILVNNAGAIGDQYRLVDMPIEAWDHLMAVDLRGVFLVTKFALPHMRKDAAAPGKIINIASELALKGRAEFTHYCSAKAAVIGFTKALALELAPEILVNAIAPGPIATDMILKDMLPEWIEKEKDIPLRRLGEPREVAATAVLLASDDGNFYTGQTLSPNGGAVLH
jgi:3-oxoacyl-[acyl-carrier protein] reductase